MSIRTQANCDRSAGADLPDFAAWGERLDRLQASHEIHKRDIARARAKLARVAERLSA